MSSPTLFFSLIVEFIMHCNFNYLMNKKMYMVTSIAAWIALHLCTVKWQEEEFLVTLSRQDSGFAL